MPMTGGGDPLPTKLGCRFCAYETADYKTHARARYDLGKHVEAEHPEQYQDALARAGRRLATSAEVEP